MATTGPGLWHRLGLPKPVREPTDSDDEPIVNPPPIADIITEIETSVVPPLQSISPQLPITSTYHHRPRAPPKAPHSAPQADSIETRQEMPLPSPSLSFLHE